MHPNPTSPNPPLDEGGIGELMGLLRDRRTVVLAGAGCSTESGIPDYRGPEGSLRKRKPMQYKEFVGSAEGRVRYWSRSAVGWPVFSSARPNPAHYALAELEQAGVVGGMITQNVDGLHQEAGSRDLVELHGSLSRVKCLDCGEAIGRDAMQRRLIDLNPAWLARLERVEGDVLSAPDGDADVPTDALPPLRVPDCEGCEGVLKPDVVFFGENVPRPWVDAAWAALEEAEVLLVVGSSLTVFSGRRFVYGAQKAGLPIAILNLGPTRADELAEVKVEARVGEALPLLARELAGAEHVDARQRGGSRDPRSALRMDAAGEGPGLPQAK